jgi:hypothetical protein
MTIFTKKIDSREEKTACILVKKPGIYAVDLYSTLRMAAIKYPGGVQILYGSKYEPTVFAGEEMKIISYDKYRWDFISMKSAIDAIDYFKHKSIYNNWVIIVLNAYFNINSSFVKTFYDIESQSLFYYVLDDSITISYKGQYVDLFTKSLDPNLIKEIRKDPESFYYSNYSDFDNGDAPLITIDRNDTPKLFAENDALKKLSTNILTNDANCCSPDEFDFNYIIRNETILPTGLKYFSNMVKDAMSYKEKKEDIKIENLSNKNLISSKNFRTFVYTSVMKDFHKGETFIPIQYRYNKKTEEHKVELLCANDFPHLLNKRTRKQFKKKVVIVDAWRITSSLQKGTCFLAIKKN